MHSEHSKDWAADGQVEKTQTGFYSLFNHIHSFDHLSSRKNYTPNSEFRVEAILAPLLQILMLTL